MNSYGTEFALVSDTQQLYISDVLVFLSVSRLFNFQHQSIWLKPQQTLVNANKYNSTDLVGLLQKSAVEHLTTYRQRVAREFGSVVTIVTTIFEALFAYKRGDYQRCLQLSTQNVHTLLYDRCLHKVNIPVLSDFMQLLDDDIVSLTALMLMANLECKDDRGCIGVSRVSLSLYLMTQCQLKLHYSVTSQAQTFGYIKVAQRKHPADRTLDQFTLKLIECKVVAYLKTLL